MHPTIDEQLIGIARLVEQAAARDPEDPTLQRLRSAAGTLRRIAGSWAELLPYFAWDNRAMLRLFAEHAGALSETQRARVEALSSASIDPLCARAAHDRNKALRAVLSELIEGLPAAASELREALRAHARERIARDPSAGRTRSD
jgi:hypothetical protein